MSELLGALGFGALALGLLYLARRAQYFTFPTHGVLSEVPLRWYQVATVFAIYFAAVTLIVPFIATLARVALPSSSPPISTIVWINFLTSSLILGSILLYAANMPRELVKKLWKRNDRTPFLSLIKFTLFSFLIAFPIVVFINEVLDLCLSFFFGIQELPEQLAVRFLKMTFQYPSYFFLSIVTIVFLAPMLEEILFRGFLQTFIRKYFGPKLAIFLTSLSFSFFHYSPEQGLANLSIIGSLFVLSFFLGFVYEKEGLLSSIFLHAFFNGVSVVNLYFFGGFAIT
jgi:membrane protease YdiL (CAAX protease family)